MHKDVISLSLTKATEVLLSVGLGEAETFALLLLLAAASL
jgi:hypothetical protein